MTFAQILDIISSRLGTEIEDVGNAAGFEVDGVPVVLQLAGEDILLVRAEVGEIPADRREAILAAAMEANYLYQGTGGATLSILPGDGRLHLQKYNWLERLDADKVFDMIERFAETAAAWARIARDFSARENVAEPADDFSGMLV